MNGMKTMMTESDNVTHDLYRYLSLCAIGVGLALEIFVVVEKAQPFEMQTFGIGIGALFAGMGLALKLKTDHPATPPQASAS